MTDHNEIELLELDEFIINSAKEKERYFKKVNESRIFVNATIYDSNKSISYIKFTSYIFVDDENDLKLELLSSEFNIKKLENAVIIGVFKLDGVKFIFESDIESWNKSNNCVTLNIYKPQRMVRLQRREAFRTNIPLKYDIKVDLNDEFKNLRVSNISITGAAFIINTSENFFEENIEFKNSRMHLNYNNKRQSFNVGLIIRRKKEVEDVLKNKTEGQLFEVGVQFDNIPLKMEQEIYLLVNEISKLQI